MKKAFAPSKEAKAQTSLWYHSHCRAWRPLTGFFAKALRCNGHTRPSLLGGTCSVGSSGRTLRRLFFRCLAPTGSSLKKKQKGYLFPSSHLTILMHQIIQNPQRNVNPNFAEREKYPGRYVKKGPPEQGRPAKEKRGLQRSPWPAPEHRPAGRFARPGQTEGGWPNWGGTGALPSSE